MTHENVLPDSYKLKYFNSPTWVDITNDVRGIDPITTTWGMADNQPQTMIAQTGTLGFTLLNSSGKYLPEGIASAAGWEKGTPVQLIISYDGSDYVRFRGRVDAITINNEIQDTPTVAVSCIDWLDFAAKYPLNAPQVINNITADIAISAITAAMPVQPAAQALDVGNFLFPSLFDAVSVKTKAYEEFNKLAQSEMGYCYLQHDRINGETLVFENNMHRNGQNTLSQVPKTKADSGFLLMANSASDHILMANSAMDRIIPALTQDAVINDFALAVGMTYGDNLVNRVTVNAYPKTIGASPVVLFSLGNDKPIKINSGAARVHHYTFHNPTGGKEISGVGLINPVATTDYLFNTAADGSGTDITAFLTLSCTFSSPKATITLTNTYTQVGYITYMRILGMPIYQDSNITVILENASSESKYGVSELMIEQTYQQDTDNGEMYGKQILDANRKPHVRVNSVTFSANYSTMAMQMFLNCDVGSLIQLIDTRYGVYDWFYIQGVNFSLSLVGQIVVSWIVKKATSIASGALSPIGIEFHIVSNDYLNFGPLPKLDTLAKFTISFWMYADQDGSSTILSCNDVDNGFYVSYSTTSKYCVLGIGRWSSGFYTVTPHAEIANQIPKNTLTHVVWTGDFSSVALEKNYLNGVPATNGTTSALLPTGYYRQSQGNVLVIGNLKVPGESPEPFGGYLKDVRIYPRVLTDAEVATLYNGGTPDADLVTDGLIFQGPCARTAELASYVGQTLTEDLPVLDNIQGAVGAMIGSPTGLAF